MRISCQLTLLVVVVWGFLWGECRAAGETAERKTYKVEKFLSQRDQWLKTSFPVEDSELDKLVEKFALPSKDTTIREARTSQCKRKSSWTYKRHDSRNLPHTMPDFCNSGQSSSGNKEAVLMASTPHEVMRASKIITATLRKARSSGDIAFKVLVPKNNQKVLDAAKKTFRKSNQVAIIENDKVETEGLFASADKPANLAVAPQLPSRDLRLAYAVFVSPSDPAWRIQRMMKAIYNEQDFYFLHVDALHLYQDDEDPGLQSRIDDAVATVKQTLRDLMPKGNIKVEAVFDVSWGGVSMLNAELAMVEGLASMGEWDYVINLSSTDMPLKRRDELLNYLKRQNQYGKNFMWGLPQSKDAIRKRGLEHGFTECEGHTFRVHNNFALPNITMIGGSSWFVLHRSFVDWLVGCFDQDFDPSGNFTNACDVPLRFLDYGQYKLSFEELFFQTVTSLSPYCELVDRTTDLRSIEWKRQTGETDGCLHNEEVDWCGNSPRFLTTEDWDSGVKKQDRFFSRKYRDPDVYDYIDEKLGIKTDDKLSPSERSEMESDRVREKSRHTTSAQNVLPGRATVHASSFQDENYKPIQVADGNLTTRWSSSFQDHQDVTIEFSTNDQPFCNISQIILHWETAYAKGYFIEVSDDLKTWRQVYEHDAAKAVVKTRQQLRHTVDLPGDNSQLKALRLNMTKRATKWGYSIWEIEALGDCMEIEGTEADELLGIDQPV